MHTKYADLRLRDAIMSGAQGDADYEALLLEAEQQGLYGRTYVRYGLYLLVNVTGMAACLYLVTQISNPVFQVFNAIAFAFFSVQGTVLGHDLSHGGVFHSVRANRIWSSLVLALLGGVSESYWVDDHHAHHKYPNYVGHDPDATEMPFMFTPANVQSKSKKLQERLLPHQHIFFWLVLPLAYPIQILKTSHYFFYKDRSPKAMVEVGLVILHFIVLFYIIFSFLPFFTGLLFLFIEFFTMGLYLASIFAPNHKGRPEIGGDEPYKWEYQIIFNRNIHPSLMTFFILSGIAFQIEHHIFPTMSRFKHPKAQPLMKVFCKKKGIEYHETSWTGSFKEMYVALKTQAKAPVPHAEVGYPVS